MTHLKIFVWVFERPLHWQNAWDFLFFLNLLPERCDEAKILIDSCKILEKSFKDFGKAFENLFKDSWKTLEKTLKKSLENTLEDALEKNIEKILKVSLLKWMEAKEDTKFSSP